ncbi:MAG: MGMT family protein [bacterium]|nr:MGMT family protein [bacterium]MDZ4299514.1 MGMT family protein [Candidatus Sungbacteria bacterium]
MKKRAPHPALRLLKKIPRGKVVTYKEIARACKTFPRVVGRIMAGNADPVDYPCYKVVASNGALTGYSAPGGLITKRQLLASDGVQFLGGRVHPACFHRFSRMEISEAQE